MNSFVSVKIARAPATALTAIDIRSAGRLCIRW
jgi:hypothetical protein